VLSRHGARDPTSSKSAKYAALIERIKASVSSFQGEYAFLANYSYTLGADQLTTFGQQQMMYSGVKFYQQYQKLAETHDLFVRASGQDRVVESGINFTQGYYQACTSDKAAHACGKLPYPIIQISEDSGSNNTLSHDICDNFESGPDSVLASDAQQIWMDVFTPSITSRLNFNLEGANLTDIETIFMMDLCPFNTIASTTGKLSQFCNLFTEQEWHQYDYFQSLGKYYGYGNGNPLGPTQGVGFTNELIARMTGQPVQDHTSTNHTLDDSNATFPLGPGHVLFADFSHDKYVL
jgi:hypothetical protein